MLKSNIFGIDLAKTVIQVCQISKHGELVLWLHFDVRNCDKIKTYYP